MTVTIQFTCIFNIFTGTVEIEIDSYHILNVSTISPIAIASINETVKFRPHFVDAASDTPSTSLNSYRFVTDIVVTLGEKKTGELSVFSTVF